jgi:hypothetical protein
MRMLYGFIFPEDEIKEVVAEIGSDSDELVDSLNAAFENKDLGIHFGFFDVMSPDYHVYVGIEVTCDVDLDAENNKFSIDISQITENDEVLMDFLENNPELENISFSPRPRLFFMP